MTTKKYSMDLSAFPPLALGGNNLPDIILKDRLPVLETNNCGISKHTND